MTSYIKEINGKDTSVIPKTKNMKIMIDKIVKECNDNGLKVEVENRGGELAYRVFGFSKSGSALLYIDDNEIICETRYGQKDHLLTFSDLVLVAKSWYENYRDRAPFERPETEWLPLLEVVYDCKNSIPDSLEDLLDDLPF